ncbi:MAG: hypothetical protein ABFR47_02735 [Verrucomicrobiota bacterium]
MKRWLSFLGLLLLTGCATVPFEPEPKADLRGVDAGEVVSGFDAAVGQRFELLQSVVFSFFGKGFTGLGYLSIDPESDAYALSCMTPAGITLFELRGEGDNVDALFMPPQLEKHGDHIARSMGRDLKRIYFGWSPPDGAKVKRRKSRLVFKSKQDGETVKHLYSGSRHLLTEKRFSKGWRTRCVVRYYDYEEIDGRLYPRGIILYNKQFHYRMVLRLKTVYPVQDNG